MTPTNLSTRMRKLAEERDDLPSNWIDLADRFDTATAGFYASPQTVTVKQFMGHYVRARRARCDATGEPLV